MSNYAIRNMKENEIQLAIDWACEEGWNPGLNDATCFYQADPNGFFLGLLDNEPIAVGSAVIYDDNFAFSGLYIVKKEFRGKGYGLALTKKLINYIGNRRTGIDGVLENVLKYERLGCVSCYKQTRYELSASSSFSPAKEPSIIPLTTIPFHQLETFDRQYFPAQRSNFLRSWIQQPHSYALGYSKDQKLHGYGVIRKCFQGYKIGPLFAQSPIIAKVLFETLCSKVNHEPIYLDIPDPNQNARPLIDVYNMTKKFEVIRMYHQGIPDTNLEDIYGITTFELG